LCCDDVAIPIINSRQCHQFGLWNRL
jgi:hypothetical protein